MKKYFVMLGGNMLGRGTCDKLHEFGYNVLIIDWNETPAILGDMHIRLDVKDSKAIIEKLKELKLNIAGALSFIDLAAPTVNAINKWCGNKTMPDKFNHVLTKEHMQNCWMANNLFNRISMTDDQFCLDDIYELSQRMKLICKPNIAASSRGITICEKGDKKNFIAEAVIKAKDMSYDNKCIIEEYIEGEEFTVDLLGDSYGNVCCYGSSIQYHSENALNNHVTIKHHWNSRKYSDEIWTRIADFGIKCYKAIGLNTMFGHLEIIMKKDGTFIPVEMGARSSGFICSHTVSAASGYDYLHDYVKMLHGEAIVSGHHLNGPTSSMWFGYDFPVGTHSVKESNLEIFLDPRIQVIYNKRIGLVAGQVFGPKINDVDRDKYGYEILVGPKDVLTIESIEKAEQAFLDDFLGRT